MTNGAQYCFEFVENVFESLKQINGYVTPIELRMRFAATQFCNCDNEGILMYAIHKNWVENHLSDDDRMREQYWIDFKQHWNESLRDMYQENRRLKEKAEAEKEVKVENNTKDLANNVVGDKMGDKNEDETNQHFNSNGYDSNNENNEKDNDGRDGIKAPHRWNKACKSCANKKAKKKCIYSEDTCSSKNSKRNTSSLNKKKVKKAGEARKEKNKSGNRQKGRTRDPWLDETPEQNLEKISASHIMTVEELLVENNILKDDNPEKLPEEKIQCWGKAEEGKMSDEEGDELPEERSTSYREEEDKKSEEEVDPIQVTTDPALQMGGTMNIEEKEASATDPIENNEREEKRQHGKIIYQSANNMEQIAVATNPTLQEDNTDKNEEAVANDTDPIAVAADLALQEDGTENIEEKKTGQHGKIIYQEHWHNGWKN
eukprot:jgi/Psemu1/3115/gm1.3115_g